MLPSRGLSRTSPASLLRSRLSTVSNSPRHFSSRSRPSVLATQLPLTSSTRSPLAASVFASRHGAARNLSLWGWGSKKPAQDPATTTAATTPAEAQPTIVEAVQEQTTAAPPPAPVEHELLSSAPPSLDDFDAAAIWNLKEQIGYLKDLGLDYGWGPTAMCEWTLEHIYIYTGLPWWASIAAVAVAFRAAMFWPTVVSTRHSALLQAVQKEPEHLKAHEELQLATRNRDKVGMMAARTKMAAIKNKAGAQMRWVMVPFLTVPFSYGMFRLMRGMAAIPVPSMETGGLLWFTDLSVADPYYILPIANALLGVAMFKVSNTQYTRDPTQSKFKTLIFDIGHLQEQRQPDSHASLHELNDDLRPSPAGLHHHRLAARRRPVVLPLPHHLLHLPVQRHPEPRLPLIRQPPRPSRKAGRRQLSHDCRPGMAGSHASQAEVGRWRQEQHEGYAEEHQQRDGHR